MERGQQAQLVWNYLDEYFSGRQAQLDNELFTAPEEEWAGIVRQKIEARKFLLNLSQLMATGASAGKILSPMMERLDESR
jgi:hypothetical protein